MRRRGWRNATGRTATPGWDGDAPQLVVVDLERDLRHARETGAAVVCASHDPILVEHADALVRLDRAQRAQAAAAVAGTA